jgi:hypothetical protein
MNYYDIVIIGAGPAGLALAHACSNMKKRILVMDKEKEIGGCHRVKRVHNNLFTEHGPRIYLSSYLNFFRLLNEMGFNVDDIFVKYKYDLAEVALTKIMPSFTWWELFTNTMAYMFFLLNRDYGSDISMKEYTDKHGFTRQTQDVIDRLCRFMDGGSIHTYSLNKLLRVSDAMNLLDVYQPKEPLDVSLFPHWKKYLEARNVKFALGVDVTYIHKTAYNQKIQYIVLNNKDVIYLNKLVLAVPPTAMIGLLKNSNCPDCFGNIDKLADWSEKTKYIDYISITYHFKEKLDLPAINGMTFDTEWRIVVINLSDYMQEVENGNNTVLSVAISDCDAVSRNIMKTANECSKDELIAEVARQIKKSLYPDLPEEGYTAIMNPNIFYDTRKNKWVNTDHAYFNAIGTSNIPFNSKTASNMYNVGAHNGYSHLSYTTLESAVSNALVLSCLFYPQLRSRYYLLRSLRISDMIPVILIVIFLLVVIYAAFSISKFSQ